MQLPLIEQKRIDAQKERAVKIQREFVVFLNMSIEGQWPCSNDVQDFTHNVIYDFMNRDVYDKETCAFIASQTSLIKTMNGIARVRYEKYTQSIREMDKKQS